MTRSDVFNSPPTADVPRAIGRILAIAAALWVCLLPFRAMVVGYIAPDAPQVPEFSALPVLIMASVYDFGFVAALALGAITAYAIVQRWRVARGIVFAGFVLLTVLALIWGMANVQIVQMLWRPLNYQWLYYSDLLRTFDARQALGDVFHDRIYGIPKLVLYAAGANVAMLMLAWLILVLGRLINRRVVTTREMAFAIVPLACAYLIFGNWYLVKHKWPRPKVQNPIVSFAASAVRGHNAPLLFTMHTTKSADDFQTVGQRRKAAPSTAPSVADAGIRNVLFFVMESVPAEYVGAYGSKYPVTPELDKYRDRAAIFRNIYAHAPSTNMSLLSILCSAYPWISYQSTTEEHPDIPLPSLSAVLHSNGWRTGFFHSSDLSYQNAGEFLESRGFDHIEDYRQRHCDKTYEARKEWSYLNGTDDLCTVESVLNWIDQKPDAPFFAMTWTMMTHYPYVVRDELRPYGVADQYLSKYLNALRCSDEALGKLLKSLEDRKLLDSTLVIVVGDHGEAFNQHGTYGHGSAIYEENLHVPLMLINPKLFHGESFQTLGALSDLAPTVLDLFRVQQPEQWQGKSLWATDRSERVYFFAPWSDALFGYRDLTHKLIFNATQNRCEVYDLRNDPGETRNLAATSDEFIKEAQQRLAAWVQYETQFYKPLMGKPTGN